MKIESTSSDDFTCIQELTHRYAHALDNRDGEALMACFAPGVMSRELLNKVIEFHRKYEYTAHHVLNHLYTVTGDVAKGTHYSLVTYVKNNEGVLTKFDTYARYEDVELVRQGGRWLIAKSTWTPIFSTAEIPVGRDVPAGFWEGLR